MKFDRSDYTVFFLLLVTVAITLYGFASIEGQVAVHFDASGQPDSYMGLVPGLLFAPLLGAGMFLLFKLLPRIDPLGENYRKFGDVYGILKVLTVAIMGYVQLMIVLWNTSVRFNPAQMVIPVVFSAYYVAGMLLEKAERNWFVGIRTPWTMSSDQVWKQTHERAAPLMKLAAVVSLGGLWYPEEGVWFFVVPAVAASLYATVYSYIAYRRIEA